MEWLMAIIGYGIVMVFVSRLFIFTDAETEEEQRQDDEEQIAYLEERARKPR